MTVDVLERSLSTLAALVVEDVPGLGPVTWSDRAADFQWEFARRVLDQSEGVPRQHWDERARGANKTTDVAALCLTLLLEQAPHKARLYVGSLDEDAAAELIDKARTIIELTALGALFEVTDLTVRHRKSGAKLIALPMDASAMGKDAWLLVLDEVTNWPDVRRAQKFWSVLTSGNRKRAGCRTVVIANAPEAAHWSYRLREVAVSSEHWSFRSVPAPLPWQTEEDMAVLRENSPWVSEYERLHLNMVTTGEDSLASRADVEACAELQGSLSPVRGRQYVIGLDMATRRDNAVGAVMHAEPPGVVVDSNGRVRRSDRPRLVVDRLQVWTPDRRRGREVEHQDVEAWVVEQAIVYGAWVHYDPAQLHGSVQRFRAYGLHAVEYSQNAASVGRLGAVLSALLRDREILLPADEELIEELIHVRLVRNGPGSYKLDHDADRHDDRATAIALGAMALLDPPFAVRALNSPGVRWAGITARR